MPSTIKFLGASVLNINSSIGWNGNPSELKVDLVEDPTAGDSFTGTNVGSAITLTCGSVSFRGLLKKYVKDRSPNGYPKYTVHVSDPRHLLDDAKLILADYNLSVAGIFNLYNVFGYYENLYGYGGSQANETGIPWKMIRDALVTIAGGGYTAYGGLLLIGGATYTLNLTQLPSGLPDYFRVGGHSHGMSILEFIQTVCDAANYDFYIKLSGTEIQVKTVARVNAYPLGTIDTALTSTFANRVIRSSAGNEERAENTSAFIIGGEIQTLYQATPIGGFENSFWGFERASGDETDIDNLRPIVGSVDGTTHWANFYSAPGSAIYAYPVKLYNIYVDSPTIANYIGSTTYQTNDLEMQIILGLGQTQNSLSSWIRYLFVANNSVYQQINLTNSPPHIIQPRTGAPALPGNVINTTRAGVIEASALRTGSLITTGYARLKSVYDFLANFARNYYGKKWAIHIPGVARKLDAESGKIGYSDEISDGGWVDATDPNDLGGLPAEAYNRFQTQDGRFEAFVKYDASGVDISRVNKSTSFQALNSYNLYSKINIDRKLYFDASGYAYAIIDTDPVYDYPNSIVGLSGVVGALYISSGISIESFEGVVTSDGANTLRTLIQRGTQGSVPLVIHPKPKEPLEFQIPLKSNVYTYGPWWAQGASGRIHYEQDPSLVPWNYNGYTNLNLVGNAKASSIVSNVQVIEAGYIEVEGLPEYDIGDIIQANGPNITNISVDIGSQGYTTTYRFETYVPRPGQIGKYNIDRLRRLNISSLELGRKIRNRTDLIGVQSEASRQAVLGNLPFQRLFHRGIIHESPQNVLVANVVVNATGHKTAIVSSASLQEAISLVPTDTSGYQNFAAASIESIIKPYTIYEPWNYSGHLPRQGLTYSINPTGILTSKNLTPWIHTTPTGYVCKYYTKATVSGYEDINDYNWTDNPASSGVPKQVLGMSAPLVLNGWGYDLMGNETPSAETRVSDISIHKVGPVDLLWDDYRKVWSCHDLLKGVTEQDIEVLGTGTVGLYQGDNASNIKFNVKNWGNGKVPSGTKVTIGYFAHDNQWGVIGEGQVSISGDTGNIAVGPNFQFISKNADVTEGFKIQAVGGASGKVEFILSDANIFSNNRGLVSSGTQYWGGDKQLWESSYRIFPKNAVGGKGGENAFDLTDNGVTDGAMRYGLKEMYWYKFASSPSTERVLGKIEFDTFNPAGGMAACPILTSWYNFYDNISQIHTWKSMSGIATNPAYAISGSTGGVKYGIWGTDPIGNKFAGGLAYELATSISSGYLANSNFPLMKPYSYKANLLSSWSTPTDAVLADYTVQNTLSSGWKFQGFAAGGEPQVVDFSTLQSSVSGGGGTSYTFADQSAMETPTSTVKMVNPVVVQYHPGVAKAWVTFDGTGTVSIKESHNVSSVTDNGTGDYTIGFTTAFATAHYCVAGLAKDGNLTVQIKTGSTPTTTACDIEVNGGGSMFDSSKVTVVFFGDQ